MAAARLAGTTVAALHAYAGVANDPVSGNNALLFSQPELVAARASVENDLLAGQPAINPANIRWAVALGGVWSNVDPSTARWASRFNLINDIVAVFGMEPYLAALSVDFDVANQAFV